MAYLNYWRRPPASLNTVNAYIQRCTNYLESLAVARQLTDEARALEDRNVARVNVKLGQFRHAKRTFLKACAAAEGKQI